MIRATRTHVIRLTSVVARTNVSIMNMRGPVIHVSHQSRGCITNLKARPLAVHSKERGRFWNTPGIFNAVLAPRMSGVLRVRATYL